MKTRLLILFFGLFAIVATAQNYNKNVNAPQNQTQNQNRDLEDFWEIQASAFPTASTGIGNISIVDENVVWAQGYDGSGGGGNFQVFTKTTDGGATWTPGTIDIASPGSGIAMIHALSDMVAWTVAFPNAGGDAQGIYKTTDGGTTWVRQNTALFNDPVAFSNVVYFWDENKGFCQGDPVDGYYELYTTDDGGTNWTRVPSADIPAPTTGEYGYTSQIFVAGDALWWTTNAGRIYRSYDFGHTFEVFQSPLSDFGGAAESGEISFADDNNGYLINQDGTFWTSNDGGATWNLEFPNTGLVFGGGIEAIVGTNAAVSVGAGAVTGSSYTVNGGLDWVVMSDVQHLDVEFLDVNVGWSGGFTVSPTEGGVFKYIGDPLLTTIDILEDNGFVAYPNPIQDVLRMSAMKDITSVRIYNIMGQEVHFQNVNSLFANVDTSNFANGTYIVEVTIGSATGSMKIVK